MDPQSVVIAVVAGVVIKVVDHFANKRGRNEVRRELLSDEGENGDATIKRTLREIQEDVRDVRKLGTRVEDRFDQLDDKVDGIGERVSKLEYITGIRRSQR